MVHRMVSTVVPKLARKKVPTVVTKVIPTRYLKTLGKVVKWSLK